MQTRFDPPQTGRLLLVNYFPSPLQLLRPEFLSLPIHLHNERGDILGVLAAQRQVWHGEAGAPLIASQSGSSSAVEGELEKRGRLGQPRFSLGNPVQASFRAEPV
jgi:hypothetical protein